MPAYPDSLRSAPRPDGVYRLTFLLPASISAEPGRHQPCRDGCLVAISRDQLVAIEGPSREAVFDQARRFLRITCRERTIEPIAATLHTPAGFGLRGGASDGWQILVRPGAIDLVPTSAPISVERAVR